MEAPQIGNPSKVDKNFENLGKAPGIFKWRIEKFELKKWPDEKMSEFFSGDSFLLLHSYKKGNSSNLDHDIFFWLGNETTLDESGTAAVKCVELDNFFHGKAVQHREVEGHESTKFLNLFKDGLKIFKGGIDSGFTSVKPEEYKPKLLHLKGRKRVIIKEVLLTADSLNEGDAFILDQGLKLYQWTGKKANPNELYKVMQITNYIKSERKGKAEIIVMRQGEEPKEFWDLLGGQKPIKNADEGGNDADFESKIIKSKSLWKLSNETGKMVFEKIAEGENVKKTLLNTMDVFVLDCIDVVYIWIGRKTSPEERRDFMQYATNYLKDNNRPNYTPIVVHKENSEVELFWESFA